MALRHETPGDPFQLGLRLRILEDRGRAIRARREQVRDSV